MYPIIRYLGFGVIVVNILSWGYMGIMERKMETSIMGYIGII